MINSTTQTMTAEQALVAAKSIVMGPVPTFGFEDMWAFKSYLEDSLKNLHKEGVFTVVTPSGFRFELQVADNKSYYKDGVGFVSSDSLVGYPPEFDTLMKTTVVTGIVASMILNIRGIMDGREGFDPVEAAFGYLVAKELGYTAHMKSLMELVVKADIPGEGLTTAKFILELASKDV